MGAESKGVAAAGKDLGVKTIFTGPTTANSESQQLQLLRSAIASNPDGIAFSLFSPGPSTALINQMKAKKMAVALWNIQTLGTASEVEKGLAYVGQDEEVSGSKNGSHLLTYLKSPQTVLIATAFQGFPLTVRRSGATDVLKKAGHKVKFLYTGQDIVHGQGLIDAYVSRNPDIKAFMALDSISATSIGKYLEASGKAKSKPAFSSFDLSPITLGYIQQGLLNFTLDQQPYVQGYMAMVNLYMAKKYGMSPVDINTGTLFIDKSNAGSLADLVKRGIGA
jgi:simple sugar transport system substrate-binding protein